MMLRLLFILKTTTVSGQGLNKLLLYKRKYPDTDLSGYMKKLPANLQASVERGLKSLNADKEAKARIQCPTSGRATHQCPCLPSLLVLGTKVHTAA